MTTFAITINIDNDEIETQFINAVDLTELKTKYEQGEGDLYNRKMDWYYDVVEVHDLGILLPNPPTSVYLP